MVDFAYMVMNVGLKETFMAKNIMLNAREETVVAEEAALNLKARRVQKNTMENMIYLNAIQTEIAAMDNFVVS